MVSRNMLRITHHWLISTTFSIAAGRCALVGESVAANRRHGLLRYYDVGGGRISVDGTDVRSWDVLRCAQRSDS